MRFLSPLSRARKSAEEGAGRVLGFVKCRTGHEPGHDAVDRLAPNNLRMRSEAMSYKHTAEKLADYRRQIGELRQKMRDVQAAVEPEAVKDYTFRRAGGVSVRLSELFGDKADLFVIHNMGQSCPYCTLWADG